MQENLSFEVKFRDVLYVTVIYYFASRNSIYLYFKTYILFSQN